MVRAAKGNPLHRCPPHWPFFFFFFGFVVVVVVVGFLCFFCFVLVFFFFLGGGGGLRSPEIKLGFRIFAYVTVF